MRQSPVIRVLIPFCTGTLFACSCDVSSSLSVIIFLCLGLTLIQVLLYFLPGRPGYHPDRGILFPAMLVFFMAGWAAGVHDRPVDPGIPVYERVLVEGRVSGEVVHKDGFYRFTLSVRGIYRGNRAWKEKQELQVTMASLPGIRPSRGEKWLLAGELRPVKGAMNPGQTDYRKVLGRKDRWYFFQAGGQEAGLASQLPMGRRLFNTEWIRYHLSLPWANAGVEGKLLQALCLGDRGAIDSELRETFNRAGGGHILAVSGLHVGLLWWVLDRILFLLIPPGSGTRLRGPLLVLALWLYAGLTGFSPSVCRSVTMFTFWSVSRFSGLRGHGLNMLLLSFFVLILFRPGNILDMGFQLSYSAVFSILILHPVLKGIFPAKKGILSRVWDLTALSLAAQAGTFPLVLFYFHQFPVYALVTNLVAIPILSAIVLLFVCAFPSLILHAGPGWISDLMLILSRMLCRSMDIIATLPGSVVEGLYADRLLVLLLMCMLGGALLAVHTRSRSPLYPCILLLAFILLRASFLELELRNSSSLVVHHLYGGSILTFRKGHKVDHYVWIAGREHISKADRIMEDGWKRRCYERSVVLPDRTRIRRAGISSCIPLGQDIWLAGSPEFRVLVVRGPAAGRKAQAYPYPGADIILLSGEPELAPGQLAGFSGRLVADGSNRQWYADRLSRQGIVCYSTARDGAYEARKKSGSWFSYR